MGARVRLSVGAAASGAAGVKVGGTVGRGTIGGAVRRGTGGAKSELTVMTGGGMPAPARSTPGGCTQICNFSFANVHYDSRSRSLSLSLKGSRSLSLSLKVNFHSFIL